MILTIPNLSKLHVQPTKTTYLNEKYNRIYEKNSQFLKRIYECSKLDDNVYTALPTIIFLSCSFIVLFLQFHKYTCSYTKWSKKLYRDLMLQWTFFYLARIWFLFVKVARWVVTKLDFYVTTYSPKNEVYLNKIMSHLCVFLIVLSIGMIPMLVLTMKELYSRSIPNFLMWVGEDPWLRSEIGPSGHYLERPPRMPIHSNKNMAFRSRRSTSVETNIWEEKCPPIRLVRSMQVLNASKSMSN